VCGSAACLHARTPRLHAGRVHRGVCAERMHARTRACMHARTHTRTNPPRSCTHRRHRHLQLQLTRIIDAGGQSNTVGLLPPSDSESESETESEKEARVAAKLKKDKEKAEAAASSSKAAAAADSSSGEEESSSSSEEDGGGPPVQNYLTQPKQKKWVAAGVLVWGWMWRAACCGACGGVHACVRAQASQGVQHAEPAHTLAPECVLGRAPHGPCSCSPCAEGATPRTHTRTQGCKRSRGAQPGGDTQGDGAAADHSGKEVRCSASCRVLQATPQRLADA